MSEQAKVNSVEELFVIKPMRTDEEVKRLIYTATFNFKGDGHDLITAAGCLVIGRLYGWRVIRLIYSNKRVSEIQDILSTGMENGQAFKFSDWMKDEERFAYRSVGLWLAKKAKSFWDVIRGVSPVPIEQRRLWDEDAADELKRT